MQSQPLLQLREGHTLTDWSNGLCPQSSEKQAAPCRSAGRRPQETLRTRGHRNVLDQCTQKRSEPVDAAQTFRPSGRLGLTSGSHKAGHSQQEHRPHTATTQDAASRNRRQPQRRPQTAGTQTAGTQADADNRNADSRNAGRRGNARQRRPGAPADRPQRRAQTAGTQGADSHNAGRKLQGRKQPRQRTSASAGCSI